MGTKLILGDFASFDYDMVNNMSDIEVFAWIIGMVFALILIIIMLNLLIAFVNDSYDKFVNIKQEAFLIGKIGLIVDLEKRMMKTQKAYWVKVL